MQRAHERRGGGRALAVWLALGLAISAGTSHAQTATSAAAIRRALDAGAYARAEALALTRVVLLDAQPRPDPRLLLSAQDLLVESRVKNGKGGAFPTLIVARRIVRMKERRVGRVHVETAQSLHNLGLVRAARGELAKAIPLFERALAIRRASLPADSANVADTLDQLALVLIQLEQFKDARVRLDESMRIRDRRAADPIGLSRTLELVGTLYRYAGPYADAGPPLERALAIRTRLTPTHPETASVMQVHGDVLFLRGDSGGALHVWSSALAMAERTLGPEHPSIAEFLRRLGFAEFSSGRLTEARRLRERAVRVGEAALAPCDPAVTRLLNGLAQSMQYDGDYFEARRLYGRALATIERCLGTLHSDYATYIFNDASLAREIGDLAEADALYQRALQIWTDGLGPTHAFVARGLDALAEVAALRGQLDRSRELYERALAIYRSELGAAHPQVAWMLTNLARTVSDQGNTGLGMRYVDEAVGIFRKSGSSDDPDHLARVLELRGSLQIRTGNLTGARASLVDALAARERIFGRAHPLAASTRAALAAVDFAQGQSAAALTAALDAEQTGRDHLRFTVRYLPERQAMAYAAKRPRGLDLALSIAAASVPDDASRIFESLIRSRGVLLDELAARRAASYTVSPQGTSANADAIAARQRFANLVVRSLIEPVPRNILDEARKQKEDAERLLAERTVEGRVELAGAAVAMADLRRALPSGAVLVSFVRYDRTPTRGNATAAQPTVPSYAAFVTTSSAARVAFVPLGPATSIEPLVTEWRKAAIGEGLPPLASRERAESLYTTAADRIRAAVWDPIEQDIGAARQVFIVPDGMLNLVNIAALSDRQGRYLIERDAVIHYLSTERDIVLLGQASSSHGSLLAIGNPAFDNGAPSRVQPSANRSNCEAAGPPRFGNLPGSLSEVNEISRIWPSSGSSLVTVLSGSTASETAVKKAIAGRRVVHFATHGFFIGEECPPATGTRGGASHRIVSGRQLRRRRPREPAAPVRAGAGRSQPA